jgi:peroxiredoxin
MALAEGKQAPDFALPDEEGRTVRDGHVGEVLAGL